MAQGKSIKDRKVYPIVLLVTSFGAIAGLLSLFLSRFQVDILISPIAEPLPSAVEPPISPSPRPTKTAPMDASNPLWNPAPTLPANPTLGFLRVSNQTEYPMRLVLLAKQTVPSDGTTPSQPYAAPAHWDFAPEEGRNRGLILSLPDGKLKVQPGDILVAFSLDGSQVYWGPHVVGSTAKPVWNQRVSEWQLVLRP